MTGSEKRLYHQIHPLKLCADWAAGIVALVPLWRHELLLGLGIMLIVPAVASFLVIRFADLEPYKGSALGRYVARYMTPAMEAIRLVGMLTMAVGAWVHAGWLIPLGLAVILFGWLCGKLFRAK